MGFRKDALVLFRAWKSSNRKFKVGGLALFAVVVFDAATAAVGRGAVDALWCLDVFFLFLMVAVFYVFLAPVAMYIMYIGARRELQQGRRDLETVLADVLLYSALCFALVHAFFASSIMQVMP